MAIDNFYSYPLHYYFYLYKVKIKALKKICISFFRIFVAMKEAIRGIAILMSFIFLLNTLLSGIYLSYFLVS